MGRLYVSVKPFADDSGETYAENFIDVSRDVVDEGVSAISKFLDNNEFDIGIFRHSSFSLKLANTLGKYADVGSQGTIFQFARNNSIVRIEWDRNNELYSLGFHRPGRRPCSERILIGDFFLSDDLVNSRSNDVTVEFTCLGYTVLFDRETVPFAAVTNADLFSEVIFKCLNQTTITRYLEVDSDNIECDLDIPIDDKTLGDLENKTVTEAFKKLLQYANSVLLIQRIDGVDTVIVKPRSPSDDLKYTFYGAGVIGHHDNIADIFNQNSGLKKVKNLVTVKETSIVAREETSITKNGVRKKEIDFLPVTDAGNRQLAANAIRDEFGNPKVEMRIRTPLFPGVLTLNLLDKVNVDYPPRVLSPFGDPLAEYGHAVVDEDYYAIEVLDIEIFPETLFKILSIELDLIDEEAVFEIREV